MCLATAAAAPPAVIDLQLCCVKGQYVIPEPVDWHAGWLTAFATHHSTGCSVPEDPHTLRLLVHSAGM